MYIIARPTTSFFFQLANKIILLKLLFISNLYDFTFNSAKKKNCLVYEL